MPDRPPESNRAARLAVVASGAEPEPGDAGYTERLVARAQRGDLRVWSRLYQQHFDGVYRQVCFLTGDPVVSEDLVQDVFARALTSIAKFDGRSSFSTWIRGIARNVVRMHWRRLKTTRRAQDKLAREDVHQPGLDGEHLQRVRMRVVYDLLEALPDHLREAFVMRDIQGLSVAEAAEILDISGSNMAVRASRARARIRRELVRLGWLSAEGEP